ncbi:MAG TPA: hypothetical protein VGQ96_04885 [Candidatus Eremiobacteraceae bacterium]|nr:hypothetical protein [Candidatus Eremiobacteraceae bacterium]
MPGRPHAHKLSAFVGLIGAVLLFGAAAAQAADLYSYQPPAGWQDFTHTNFGDRADAVWRGPTDAKFGENVLVLVKPGARSLEQASDSSALLAQWPQAKIAKRAMTVCGGHPAAYVYVAAPWHGKTLISENVISVWDGVVFSATYSHLSYQETVQAARASLATLCPGFASRNSATTW